MNDIEDKYTLLKRLTSDASAIREIIGYTENKFTSNSELTDFNQFPLPDAAFVPAWERYQEQSDAMGVFETLKSHLVQLQFPIQKNISLSDKYRAATLKGKATCGMLAETGLQLNDAEALELIIYPSIAGKIPVLIVPDNQDFCNLIRALSHKNEPINIPNSMGAAMINGINNWSRINEMKVNWTANNPFGNWNARFMKNILPNKSLYQDKIIVLSKKTYSGISSESLELTSEQWLNLSLKIRLEHECTHFFTLNQFGHMANNMHDELVADYMGITKVLGKFDARWFLKFVGLENYPKYRQGARLENYLGNPPISKKSFEVLTTIVKRAADNVALFDGHLGATKNQQERIRRLTSLCSLDLIQISSESGLEKLLLLREKIGTAKIGAIFH